MKNILPVIILFLLLLFISESHAVIMNGKVLTVNKEHNFLIINLGKEDGVKKGMVFLVHREKRLVGKVEAEEVFKDMSSCNILPWIKEEEIKKDDGVLKP